MVPHPNICPECGGRIPPDAPEGLCRFCLLHGALEDDAAEIATNQLDDPPSIPPTLKE